MTFDLAYLLVILGLFLVLTAIALLLNFRKEKNPNLGTRLALVALRLAIGWHFLFEGVDKLNNPAWSSEGYLRESIGPLAEYFRWLAGDSIRDRLTVQDQKLSPFLDQEWQAYLDELVAFYDLGESQKQLVQADLDQAKAKALNRLTVDKKSVEIPSLQQPPLIADQTIPQRLAYYRTLEQRLRELEEVQRVEYGEVVFFQIRIAKRHLNDWRGDLQRDLRGLTKEMQRAVQRRLVGFAEEKLPADSQKSLKKAKEKIQDEAKTERAKEKIHPTDWDAEDRFQDRLDEKTLHAFRNVLSPNQVKDKLADLGPQAVLIYHHIIDKKKKGQPLIQPLPVDVGPPLAVWTWRDWSDRIVKYGLVAVGGCLLAGLLTRTACVLGAGYLLMFFLAMPPLPGWPESPRVEGHYYYVNKTLIEMLALLALATMRTGRWVGIDGVLQFFRPSFWRRETDKDIASSPPVPVRPVEKPAGIPPLPLTPSSKEISHGT